MRACWQPFKRPIQFHYQKAVGMLLLLLLLMMMYHAWSINSFSSVACCTCASVRQKLRAASCVIIRRLATGSNWRLPPGYPFCVRTFLHFGFELKICNLFLLIFFYSFSVHFIWLAGQSVAFIGWSVFLLPFSFFIFLIFFLPAAAFCLIFVLIIK